MFGYPTGVGALIARHEALAKLHRPWFAGGTIDVASVQADRFRLAPGAPGFEDGTPDFLNIPAVELGLELIDSVGLDVVHERVRLLTGWLIEELLALRHARGRPLVLLCPASTEGRGGTLAFNLAGAKGHVIDHRLIERLAGEQRISLRTGCFCNPGAGELALGLSRAEILGCLDRSDGRMPYDDFRHCIDPKTAGAVRVSLGLVGSFADAWRFLAFARGFLEA